MRGRKMVAKFIVILLSCEKRINEKVQKPLAQQEPVAYFFNLRRLHLHARIGYKENLR